VVSSQSPDYARLPYISLEDIERNTGRILRDPQISDRPVTGNCFRFDERHVLFSKLRPYLNKVAAPWFSGKCTTELIPLLPEAGVSRDYLSYLLRRPQIVEVALKHGTGARMPRANLSLVLAELVPLPSSLKEQQEIVEKVTEKIRLINDSREACQRALQLLDDLTLQTLSEFPFNDEKL
jgi:type I restriction enzyme S subunit